MPSSGEDCLGSEERGGAMLIHFGIPLLDCSRGFLSRYHEMINRCWPRMSGAVSKVVVLTGIILCLLHAGEVSLAAEEDRMITGSVVIFTTPQSSSTLRILAGESASYLGKMFHRLGRFRPVENNRLNWAATIVRERGEEGNFYQEVASALRVDLYVLISLRQAGKILFAEMRIVPRVDDLDSMRRSIRVRSRIYNNIPLKLGRELVSLHRTQPIRARVLNRFDNNRYRLDIGQWNMVGQGRSYRIDGGYLTISEMGRYQSVCRIDGSEREAGDVVLIHQYPDTNVLANEIDRRILKNTERRYGIANTLLKNDVPEKRFIESICIINLGGNVCLPGYGSYLSTHYMGFKGASPDVAGIVLSSTLVAVHFTLPAMLTRFRTNFFPWKKDHDKTGRMQNLQTFLWATVPLTFSTAYLNQLAYQFQRSNYLPPFFNDKDAAATALSLFIPGGGLFYKGYRFGGWGYYFSEMLLAGYGVYNYHEGQKGRYALLALAALKGVELLHAYFVEPSYPFYRMEMEREIRLSLSADVEQYNRGKMVYRFGVMYSP